jgi:acetyl esterase
MNRGNTALDISGCKNSASNRDVGLEIRLLMQIVSLMALLIIAMPLAACGDESLQSTQPVNLNPTYKDVSYGPFERNKIDFWKANTTTPAPVVVAMHGGGFIGGDKAEAEREQSIAYFLDHGISFASINYRYSTQAPYPAPMLDGARAIQFLRSKADEWKIDPKRVAAYGASAGGGISLWLAFHDDLADANSSDAIAHQSTRLTCAAAVGGQTTYDPREIKKKVGGRAADHPALLPLYGLQTEADFTRPDLRKTFEDASPINHLSKDDPPVFLLYTEPDKPLHHSAEAGDGIHHPRFGRLLKHRMNSLGIECQLETMDSDVATTGYVDLFNFICDHLKPK